MMDKHAALAFITYIYWKLDVMSCVVVPRNRLWFREAIGVLDKVWRDIEDARRTVNTAVAVPAIQKGRDAAAPAAITVVPTAKLLLSTPFTKARAVAAVNAANAANAAANAVPPPVITVIKCPGSPPLSP